VDVTPTNGPTLTVYLDGTSKLPTRIESKTDDPNYGDVVIATSFSDWKQSGELMLPGTISETLDKWKNGDWTVTSRPNGTIQALAAPADVASPPDPVPPPLEVAAQELAPGVWYIGPGYSSTLIEFPSYGVLVEASNNDERVLATLAKAREVMPNKPIKYLVNTHFHIDHSGGIRAAVGEGLTIVTHELHKPYYEDIVARPHTLKPDHLAKNNKPLVIETVKGDEPMEIKEGDRSIVIQRLKDDLHADGMLMVWLPKERILVEADAFTPGGRASPFAANLLTQVRALGWNPVRIAPVHGTHVPFSELEKTVKALPAAG
jgi:glyoxylase-like metal-dependent hydrolase (beta-lactamase superfamily II)